MVTDLDVNENGTVDFDEFLANLYQRAKEEEMMNNFNDLDENGDK